ncbi:MAG: hypothetical protein NVS2B3_14460 [Vulcanimicrobiaceae bacterium]
MTFARVPQAAALAIAIGGGAWCYSAPPLRLLARGLGEVQTALVVAVLVPLCAYAAQGAPLVPRAIAGTLPGAAAIFAMMLAVEYPDVAADRATGKANLVVRFGTEAMARLGVVATVAVYAAYGGALAAGASAAFGIFAAMTLPLAATLVRAFAARAGADRCATDPAVDEALAARGVTFFFVVTFYNALAYAAPLVR